MLLLLLVPTPSHSTPLPSPTARDAQCSPSHSVDQVRLRDLPAPFASEVLELKAFATAHPHTPSATLTSCLPFTIMLALSSSPKIFLDSSLCSENPRSVPQYSRAPRIPNPVGTVLSLVPALPWVIIYCFIFLWLLRRPGFGPSLGFPGWKVLNNSLWVSFLPRRRGEEGRENIKLYKVMYI